MLNSEPEPEPEPDEDKAIAETLGVGLQSMLDGSVKQQINKGFINITGSVKGNGNGSIYVTFNNVRNYYSYSQPPEPTHEPSREYGDGSNKLLKSDHLDDAKTNGFLLSKPSPSIPSSYDRSYKINSSTSQPTGKAKVTTCGVCKTELVVPQNGTAYYCYVCQERGAVRKSISGYEQLRKDSGANLLKHNINASLLSKPSSSTSSSSLSRRCNKRAVLCGVTSRKRKYKLKGPINDVTNMKELLVKDFKFPIDCIRILTDEEHNLCLIPAKRNILESLRWLVKDNQPGDSLVFYFSRHSLREADSDEDEIDGYDETISPVDFMKKGMITDDEINSTIVWPLKKGVTLHAIIDDGYRGTILDLMYAYKRKNRNWEDNNPSTIRKHTSGGLVICLSVCEDSQMSTDSKVFGGKGMNGATTYLFTKAIREQPGITYGGLLEKMHGEIEKIHQSKCNNRILKHFFHRIVEQDPLLSSSEKFDVSTTKFTL